MAPVAHVLWSRIMKHNPANAKWLNRDRFVLSNGHGCALLYVLLHLSGADMTLDDLKQFRQWGSRTAGHPEAHLHPNIEVTTGPLGQGISNAVGLAIAQKNAAATFNKPEIALIDNYTYVFCGDGCLQEGVASEACSLAGHLGLGGLIVVYDDNKITIDGHTHLSFTEDVQKRFQAYGWHTLTVENGDTDLVAIEHAIRAAQAVKDKPTIISLKTTIGYLSREAGSHDVHGSPLHPDDIKQIKKKCGFPENQSFYMPKEVSEYWKGVQAKGRAANKKWDELFGAYSQKYPKEASELIRMQQKKLPQGWKDKLPRYSVKSKADATRNLSGTVLNALADVIPELMGGSADLTGSNKTAIKKWKDFQKDSFSGKYLRFGVREHGMAAIGNGINAYGLHIPFTATFLNFITYAWGAVRLTSLSHLQQIYIMTHDSIGLGEDGPTHQPVEVAALLRATPNMICMRPADGNEVTGAYMVAIEHRKGPTVLCLSRQNVPVLEKSSPEAVYRGAYVVYEPNGSKLDAVYIASGTEVSIAVDAAKKSSLKVRVVSAPSLELFDRQPVGYRKQILPLGVPVISVEAYGSLGWEKYSHHSIALKEWGASAPYEKLYDEFGFTPDKINKSTVKFLQDSKKVGSHGYLRCHL
eukprot:TRINITY_DN2980_c0_g1_i1.p1 TRINITY_DN2980_c0_g1~~TRINITY_DN2980_c0_g1_i1.p1  ORF type:complete len:691 (-),score=159.75 TRINITY_DN2980_c0_g1_i1:45-1961(-)